MTENTQNKNLPPDYAERERALDEGISFIVRAPAGSGKTTLLIQRYLKLLARVAQPEEILCMTFTRKAAGEMRGRVLAALQGAEGDGGDEARPELHALACEALAQSRKRQWGLLQNPARLQFYTIDGFCARLVRHLPRASGFGAAPVVEEFPNALYRRAAAAAIHCIDDGDDEEVSMDQAVSVAQAARIVLAHFHNNYERLLNLLSGMLQVRDQWLWIAAIPDLHTKRAVLEGFWDEIVRHDLRRLREAMLEQRDLAAEIVACTAIAARNLEASGGDSPILACLGLGELPPPEPEALPQWCGIATLLLTAKGELGKTVTVKKGFPPGAPGAPEKTRMMTLLGALRDERAVVWIEDLNAARALPLPRYDDAQWQVLAALTTMLKQAAARLDLEIGAGGRCDHAAVAASAVSALGEPEAPTDLALALDYRIRHILVDEFQDTSESQIRLLEMLTVGWDGSDSRTLFLVGDPMQSIYGFRLADVGIYLDVVKHGIGQLKPQPLTLSANFRSQRPLIEWVNAVFAVAMPSQSEAASGAVSFTASEVIHDGDDGAGVCFHVRRESATPGAGTEATALAAAVCDERRHDPEATMAILARSRSHLPQILRALADAEVPCKEVGLEPLARLPLVQDLLALSCALLHPSDRTAWLALLRAPWCGLGLGDLVRLHDADTDAEPWERLHDPALLATLTAAAQQSLARVVPVLEQALAQRGRQTVARWVENTWLQLGGAALCDAASWPDVRLFFDQLQALCGPTGLGDYRELGERLDQLRSVAEGGGGGEQSNPVRVMTMHGAKGLEFDVVLIPGLARGTATDQKRVMQWHKHRGRDERGERPESAPRLLLAPLDVRADGDDAMYEYIRTLGKQRDRFEDGRLLYVACTRARRRLHLFAELRVTESDDEERLAAPPSGSLLSHIGEPCAAELEQALSASEDGHDGTAPAAGAASPDEAAHVPEARQHLWRVPPDWQPPAPAPAVPVEAAPDDSASATAEQRTFDWAGQAARLTGDIVHRMLCRIAEEGLSRWNMERVRRSRALWAVDLKVRGFDQSTVERTVDNVEEALRFCLEDPEQKGCWILDENHRDGRNEYAVSGVLNGRLAHRILDRTMTDADGVRWIIDYKTGAHRGGSLQQFLDSEQQRYRAQLEEYALLMSRMTEAPIRLGLYFPLAQGWREWAWNGEGNDRKDGGTVPLEP